MSNQFPTHLLKPGTEPRHRFAFIGVPHDAATTLGNPGARFGPRALARALGGILTWRLDNHRLADIDRGTIDLSAVEVVDAGDVMLSYHDTERTVQEACSAVQTYIAKGYTPLIAGGDHGVTYPSVKALHDAIEGSIGLVQLDAHCDLMDFSDRQGRYSGSSGMRRSLGLTRVSGHHLVQVGLRGYTTVEQYEIGHHFGVHRISAARFEAVGARQAAQEALQKAGRGTQALYLTIDMDVVNPGEAPGTGWPEPGGLTGQQLIDFVRLVAPHASAVDICELNPVYDTRQQTTTILAARILFDCIVAKITAPPSTKGDGDEKNL